MAKTLLDAVNEILKRANIIAGDANALTSLVDSSHQHDIDIAVQVTNEGIDELYSQTPLAMPGEQAEATLTLVLSQREYTLATDLVQLRWPMIDRSNSQYIYEFGGGYNRMLLLDPEQDDTGLPIWGAISPITGKLKLDRAPTSQEAGRVYYYEYDKDLALTTATSPVPFTNAVFRAMVPAWEQLWKRERRSEFDQSLYNLNLGRAARFLTELQPRSDYFPR